MNIEYGYTYWGPLLFLTKLKKEDIKELRKLENENNDFSNTLVGLIDSQNKINLKKYHEIVLPYLKAYQDAFEIYYAEKCPSIKTEKAWVNKMVAGESNPIHHHANCNLSSVLFTEIPKGLVKENENFKGNGIGPGGILFYNNVPRAGHITEKGYLPTVGDFFIFPANLSHAVNPFKCKGYRVSIAANFSFEEKPKVWKQDS
jgi:hypothetical protein